MLRSQHVEREEGRAQRPKSPLSASRHPESLGAVFHSEFGSSFATSDCTLTAHAPIYGTKPGAEQAVPIADVRKQLSRILTLGRVTRHDLHLAVHPEGDALCAFMRVKMRVSFLPFTLRTIPLAFEWSAADSSAARRILIDHHGWPADTTIAPHVAFGAEF